MGGAATEPDEHTRRARPHEVEGSLVRRASADNDGDLEVIDEGLEVERCMACRHVLGRHRRAANHENVDTSGYRDRREAARGLR